MYKFRLFVQTNNRLSVNHPYWYTIMDDLPNLLRRKALEIKHLQPIEFLTNPKVK